jgi:hypothetical protein
MSVQKEDKRKWVPEICYEEYEEDQLTGGLPFIQVPETHEVPDVLFMFASKHTGEYDVGTDGDPEPIVEMELHQYACMQYLQAGLSAEDYDKVRICLGLLPLEDARKKGKANVNEFVDNIQTKIRETKANHE